MLIRLKDQQDARGVLLSSCIFPPGSAAPRVTVTDRAGLSWTDGVDSTVWKGIPDSKCLL